MIPRQTAEWIEHITRYEFHDPICKSAHVQHLYARLRSLLQTRYSTVVARDHLVLSSGHPSNPFMQHQQVVLQATS
jgi:hypothetical protein